ncbi:hypothetical protein SNOG_12744 [Parastagonospora nodorum SN15]|uniref:Coupling of ubiquitin conjugation to ER degradation protein 1 n=1 Tax=Phaeosphaeria nodorum (strain SN15 / ATCC MYA-4574 / FGSC 10173) TaxID=321614 RepID=Q0U670_PHANO|nr:hypothetical protein SNOG_12744 [Parastagonospora nodorum SN15]EAT80042.2 hypothetical protein SNOG_12744 [Parastagonospora nodorum SN15]
MTEQSINIPQVLVFLVVIFLASRWYLSKPSGAHTHAAPARSTPRINPAQIDQIAAMFPQLSRRDIAWDLQRNGGNASATTERVLGGRGLDTSEEPAKEEAPKKAWSADKNERQMNLQRRREEMILAARRKLEAQEKGKAPA